MITYSYTPSCDACGAAICGPGAGDRSLCDRCRKLQQQATVFDCRCCDASIAGTTDGTFGHDDRGPWKRIANIDGPNAACPACQADPASLDALKEDGYDNAAIV